MIQILLTIISFTASSLAICATKPAPVRTPAEHATAARNLMIHYDGASPDENKQRIVDAASRSGAEVVYLLDRLNIVVVHVSDRRQLAEAIAYFTMVPGVLAVTRDQASQVQRPR